MNILFVQENAISESLGICSLSAYLKKHGHKCDLLLLTHTKDLGRSIREFEPDLIGLTVFTGMQDQVYQIVREIKSIFDIPVILGWTAPYFLSRRMYG